MRKLIPLVSSLHPLGHLKPYVNNPVFFLEQAEKKHGSIFRFRLAHRILIATFHPEHIKHLMQDNHSNYIKSLAYRKLKVLLGDGLFTSEGSFWLRQRRLAQPAFHRDKLHYYQNLMMEESKAMINNWKSSTPSAIQQEMTDLTMRIITRCLLGLNSDSMHHHPVETHLPYALSFMIRRVTSTVNWPLSFPFKRHKKFAKSVEEMNNAIEVLIAQKRKQLKPENIDLLSMLMSVRDEDTGESMSDKQIRDEVITFFLAGHETSAMTLTWAIYLLAKHPKFQEKALKEIESGNGQEYIRQIIKETMRLYAPVWIMGREALGDDQLNEYPVKKGNSIIFSPYLIHRHPDYWKNPNEFDPERFSPQNEQTIPKYVYFPFGGGPRLCIGQSFAMMEMIIILTEIIQNFQLEEISNEHPGYVFSLTLRPSKNIPVRLKVREKEMIQ